MKRVRYAFAAAGVAPALALTAPAATAAPAIIHAQANLGKSGRLGPATARHAGTVAPQACARQEALSYDNTEHFYLSVVHYGHCVGSQFAMLNQYKTGLTERIRAYNSRGRMIFDRRVAGHVFRSGRTVFPGWTSRGPDWSELGWNPVYKICAALVYNGTNSVYDGDLVCLSL